MGASNRPSEQVTWREKRAAIHSPWRPPRWQEKGKQAWEGKEKGSWLVEPAGLGAFTREGRKQSADDGLAREGSWMQAVGVGGGSSLGLRWPGSWASAAGPAMAWAAACYCGPCLWATLGRDLRPKKGFEPNKSSKKMINKMQNKT